MENNSRHSRRAVWDRTWPTTARGGAGSTANCANAVPAPVRAGFAWVSTSVPGHSFLGTQVGLQHSGQGRRHGAAAQLNYGEENHA